MTEFGPKDHELYPGGELASKKFAEGLLALMSYYGEHVVPHEDGENSLRLVSRFVRRTPRTPLPPIEALITESLQNNLPSLTYTSRGNNRSSWGTRIAQDDQSGRSYSIAKTKVEYSGSAWFWGRNTSNSGFHPASPTELDEMLPKLYKLRPEAEANEAEKQPRFVAWLGRLVRKNDK